MNEKEKIKFLEDMLSSANLIIEDFLDHAIETCDAETECEICYWQKEYNLYREN